MLCAAIRLRGAVENSDHDQRLVSWQFLAIERAPVVNVNYSRAAIQEVTL